MASKHSQPSRWCARNEALYRPDRDARLIDAYRAVVMEKNRGRQRKEDIYESNNRYLRACIQR
jgi:hypothetical protein